MVELMAWIQTHKTALSWLGLASVIAFIGALILVPLLIARLPRDYFVREGNPRPDSPSSWKRGLRLLGLTVKNVIGIVLILAGLAMLILPGQGLLTILVGLMMIDFPGKRRMESYLSRRPAIAGAINWMRNKAGRPPLKLP